MDCVPSRKMRDIRHRFSLLSLLADITIPTTAMTNNSHSIRSNQQQSEDTQWNKDEFTVIHRFVFIIWMNSGQHCSFIYLVNSLEFHFTLASDKSISRWPDICHCILTVSLVDKQQKTQTHTRTYEDSMKFLIITPRALLQNKIPVNDSTPTILFDSHCYVMQSTRIRVAVLFGHVSNLIIV